MLDVHPAHHAASSWRDFFVHIATIVLGLLIAVGLEQTVQAIHHHHQVRDARKQIQDEIKYNIKDLAVDISRYREAKARMRNNILILEAHQAGKKVSDRLDYSLKPGYNINDGALRTAEVNGAFGMMPEAEIADYRYIESTTASEVDAAHGYFEALFQANALLRDRSVDELQPEDTVQLIQLTSVVIGKLDYAMQLQSFLDRALREDEREK